MSVWPYTNDTALSLRSSEGTLILISITVDACGLESLLDALAQLDYPINPQIYHQAAVAYGFPDGREETEPTTLVEFPAYSSWIAGVRPALRFSGLDSVRVHVTPMLDELRDDGDWRPAPAGARYERYRLIRHAELAICA